MLGDFNVCASLAVKDLAVARSFYEEKLGLKVKMDMPEGAGVFYSSGNAAVMVYTSEFAGTNKATAAGWEVDDVKATVAELTSKGITFEHYDNMQGATLDGDVYNYGPFQTAWFKDPDGNILNISSKIKA